MTLTNKPKFDFIRVYEADAIECLKCDNWEEGDKAWGAFRRVHDHYQCKQCGTFCIKESRIIEYRDWD